MIRSSVAILAVLVCALAPSAQADTLQGTLPLNFSGGGYIVETETPFTLKIAEGYYSDGPTFTVSISSASTGQDYVFDAGSSGFAEFATYLTNGNSDTLVPGFGGSSYSVSEFDTLGGQDLAGQAVTRIVVHVDAANVETPGSNPNGNGIWTDFSMSGEVRIYATVPPLLSNTVTIPAGAECPNGGRKIDSGKDMDLDDVLDEEEITQTAYACDGQDGRPVVITSETIAAGDTCAAGGSQITAGYDTDGDGAIDEVSTTLTLCNGTPGADGSDGTDGAISLLRLDAEPEGANCAAGGQRISAGVDQDGDGALDDVEITSTAYVCNGAAGQDGAAGPQGQDGTDGVNGTDGTTGAPGADGASCTVTKTGDTVKVTCPDGSSQAIPAGGCSTTGTGSLLALLPLLGLALLRRRRTA
jgi:uncharacterized protein (TIGR03382 family)